MTIDEAIEWYVEGFVALSKFGRERYEIVLKALNPYKDLGPGGKLLDVKSLTNHQCLAANDQDFVAYMIGRVELAQRGIDLAPTPANKSFNRGMLRCAELCLSRLTNPPDYPAGYPRFWGAEF